MRDVYGTKGGDWDRLVTLAEELGDRSALGEGSAYLLAQAGLITWKERHDLIKARRSFVQLTNNT